MDTDKSIDASPPEPLTRVANKYYLDKKDVRLLHIDPLPVKPAQVALPARQLDLPCGFSDLLLLVLFELLRGSRARKESSGRPAVLFVIMARLQSNGSVI
jgi:hypothetical protein